MTALHTLLLSPAWLGFDDGERLELVACPSTDRVTFEGPLRADFLLGRASPAIAALAQRAPLVRRLWEARRRAEPVRMDRSTLLRGSGFRQLFLELTGRCNERCLHCYAGAGPERAEALDERTVQRVIEDAAALGFAQVQVTGGDPLLSELCAPAAQQARELGLAVEVYTNGLALTGHLYQQLSALRVGFAFSFYSHDAAIHDAITQTRGSQRRTARAIRQVLRDGLPCRVNVVTLDENRAGLRETFAYLSALGVPAGRIGMDVQRSVGRGQMTIDPESTELPRAPAGHGEQVPCDEPSLAGRIAVTYDGQVVPCIFDRSRPLGNVRRHRLQEILLAPEPLHVDRDRVLGAAQGQREQLACWECRLRAALLPEPSLVSLRRRSLT